MINLLRSLRLRVFIIAVIVFSAVMVSFAQVQITVDTDAIFTEANVWIAVFTPIVAIGIGIAIALAILRFIGKQIVSAFKT